MGNDIKWTNPPEDKLEEFVASLKEKALSEYPDTKFVEIKEGPESSNGKRARVKVQTGKPNNIPPFFARDEFDFYPIIHHAPVSRLDSAYDFASAVGNVVLGHLRKGPKPVWEGGKYEEWMLWHAEVWALAQLIEWELVVLERRIIDGEEE